MCAANIWHHVYILFSIVPLNCYHWRVSELSLWTEPGVWSGCYLDVLMEMALCSPKTRRFVWFLKLDSSWLHGTALWTTVKCFFSRTPENVNGLLNRAATFNLTTWFNREFSVIGLEDVKMDLLEGFKGPTYALRWGGVGCGLCPNHLSRPSAVVKSEPRRPVKKNKLSHARTVELQSSSNTVLVLEVVTKVLEPIPLDPLLLTFNPLPKNVETEFMKGIQGHPTINSINEHGLPD